MSTPRSPTASELKASLEIDDPILENNQPPSVSPRSSSHSPKSPSHISSHISKKSSSSSTAASSTSAANDDDTLTEFFKVDQPFWEFKDDYVPNAVENSSFLKAKSDWLDKGFKVRRHPKHLVTVSKRLPKDAVSIPTPPQNEPFQHLIGKKKGKTRIPLWSITIFPSERSPLEDKSLPSFSSFSLDHKFHESHLGPAYKGYVPFHKRLSKKKKKKKSSPFVLPDFDPSQHIYKPLIPSTTSTAQAAPPSSSAASSSFVPKKPVHQPDILSLVDRRKQIPPKSRALTSSPPPPLILPRSSSPLSQSSDSRYRLQETPTKEKVPFSSSLPPRPSSSSASSSSSILVDDIVNDQFISPSSSVTSSKPPSRSDRPHSATSGYLS